MLLRPSLADSRTLTTPSWHKLFSCQRTGMFCHSDGFEPTETECRQNSAYRVGLSSTTRSSHAKFTYRPRRSSDRIWYRSGPWCHSRCLTVHEKTCRCRWCLPHHLSHRKSVRLSVCHTRGLCPYGLTYDPDFFRRHDSSFSGAKFRLHIPTAWPSNSRSNTSGVCKKCGFQH